ncbi:MAG: 4'-phosphopantetheinyl transferase family protein [Bryobacteraceae bacterium]
MHLWVVRLEASDDNFARSRTWLSAEENARAERFRFERHARSYVLGRASLRALLGSYLGREPGQVRFAYGPQGKPALDDEACPLRFNASNSGNLAAFAFTLGCEIGVDVEQHRAIRDLEHIAHRFFSPEEAGELMELPATERDAAFFNCWTRKEAYIKAMGGGLSIPLDSFRVTLRPGAEARMVTLEGSADRASGWTLHAFNPAPACTGAIAYPEKPRAIQAGPIVSVDELLGGLGSD